MPQQRERIRDRDYKKEKQKEAKGSRCEVRGSTRVEQEGEVWVQLFPARSRRTNGPSRTTCLPPALGSALSKWTKLGGGEGPDKPGQADLASPRGPLPRAPMWAASVTSTTGQSPGAWAGALCVSVLELARHPGQMLAPSWPRGPQGQAIYHHESAGSDPVEPGETGSKRLFSWQYSSSPPERNEALRWGKPGRGQGQAERKRRRFMNGPSGQENSPSGPPRVGPSLLPLEILWVPSAPKEATHPGSKPTTHSPASAPTRNIPVVLPNKLIAVCPGPGCVTTGAQLQGHHSQFLDFIVVN